jgi:hypothetical protein
MYRHSKENWVPDFMKRRPDVSMDTICECTLPLRGRYGSELSQHGRREQVALNLKLLWTAAWTLRKRRADRVDLNRRILRSRRPHTSDATSRPDCSLSPCSCWEVMRRRRNAEG